MKIEQPYRLAKNLVTFGQFQCFVQADDFGDKRWWRGMPASDPLGPVPEISQQRFKFDNHPRETVSWYQAIAFCRWLSHKLGYTVDLPHEHEWEVAARHPDSRYYPWGNDFEAVKTNTGESGIDQTSAVGIYPAGKNPALGLYDMSGNVWEWCRNKDDKSDDWEMGVIVDKSNWKVVFPTEYQHPYWFWPKSHLEGGAPWGGKS